MVSYIDIFVEHRAIEIASIWYTLEMQGTGANTEVAYLLIQHAFEDLGYDRMVWRCNYKNKRSM